MSNADVIFLVTLGVFIGWFAAWLLWTCHMKDKYKSDKEVRELERNLEHTRLALTIEKNASQRYRAMYTQTLEALYAKERELSFARKFQNWRGEPSSQQFTADELKTLLQLCHPDKHGGKESASRITQKILKLRG